MKKEETEEYTWNRLKTLSIDSIEKAIGSSLSELSDHKFTCNIDKINFSGLSSTLEISIS